MLQLIYRYWSGFTDCSLDAGRQLFELILDHWINFSLAFSCIRHQKKRHNSPGLAHNSQNYRESTDFQ